MKDDEIPKWAKVIATQIIDNRFVFVKQGGQVLKVHTYWGWREGEDVPELIASMDDWSVDSVGIHHRDNYFQEERNKVGIPPERCQLLILHVEDKSILEAFDNNLPVDHVEKG